MWAQRPWKVREGFKILEQSENGLLTGKIPKITLHTKPWGFSASENHRRADSFQIVWPPVCLNSGKCPHPSTLQLSPFRVQSLPLRTLQFICSGDRSEKKI